MNFRLKNLAKIIMGASPEKNLINESKVDNSKEFHQGNSLFANGRVLESNDKYSTQGKLAKGGDILISVRAPVGDLAILDRDIYIGRGLAAVRPNSKVVSKLLYYKLISLVNVLRSKETGTTFKAVGVTDVRNLIVDLLNKKLQQKIANFLDIETARIEKEIELLEKKVELLNEYQQSLIFETVTKGLDKNVKMKDSGIEWIGEIPEHWEVKRVKEVAQLNKGQQFEEKFSTEDETIPYLNGGISPSGYSKKWNTPRRSIAVSEGGASAGFSQIINKRFYAGSHCYIVTTNNRYILDYLFQVLKGVQSVLMEQKTGSAMPNLQKTKFSNFKLCITTDVEEQKKIFSFLEVKTEENIRKTELINKKITLLKEYKQSLIYEAVTGKLEIN